MSKAIRFRVFIEPQEGATYEDQLAVARLTEELGFDALFRSDHYISFFDGDRKLPGPTDAWATLAGLALQTEHIRLGAMMSPATFRLPGPFAITVAQVDAMSGGRIEVGIGAGWQEREHQAYGIPFPSLGERFERLEEYLAIVTGLWGTPVDEYFSFDGRHYHLDRSPALPKPRQRPHPPLLIGGSGARRTPRLAARYASDFNAMFVPPDGFGRAVARVRAACEAGGRDPATLGLSVGHVVVCGADEAEVARRAAAIGRTPDQARDGIGGRPAEVVDRIGHYVAAGADTVYLQVRDLFDLDHLRLLAAEVVPAFR